MTVINHQRKICGQPDSNCGSDTESLNISGSDVESIHNVVTHNVSIRSTRPRIFTFDEVPKLSKHCGKRKFRRLNNRLNLQTLSEEPETDAEKTVVFETTKSPLSKLMCDTVALKYWNEFIEKTEEEQKQILDIMNLQEKCTTCKPSEIINPILRISTKIRRTLKIRKNLSSETVKSLEDDIVQFFIDSPLGRYVKYPNTSFKRLLTHAVAQYHCLHSEGDWENDRRKVEIYNLELNWKPAEFFLHKLIAEKS